MVCVILFTIVMQQKENSVRQSEQTVLNSHKWIKKLTMILTSVLLLTMFGLGGYWLGARRQQSPPPHFLTKPKPSWLPSDTPAQRSSSASTVIPSQPYSLHSGQFESTTNWKTYINSEYGISFRYPFNAKITVQKLALLSFEQSDGITLEPPYQEPYSKWYVLDLVVRDNPQNLDAKTIIDNL